IRAKAMDLLETVNLLDQYDDIAKNLSYGQQRRLEIARALASDPKLILLDEPAAGMNERETAELHHLIMKIKEMGITILLIEHDMPLVMKTCDRLVVLNFGKKIAEGDPEEIQKDPEVIKAYLGTEEDDESAKSFECTHILWKYPSLKRNRFACGRRKNCYDLRGKWCRKNDDDENNYRMFTSQRGLNRIFRRRYYGCSTRSVNSKRIDARSRRTRHVSEYDRTGKFRNGSILSFR